MPSNDFNALRRGLYEQGIATSYADRLVAELGEHRADLEAERLAAGDSRSEAATRAKRRLGSEMAIVAQVVSRPELRGRWSNVRAALRTLLPLEAGGVHCSGGNIAAPVIVRWTASVSLGSLLTVALLLALAQSITIGL